MKKAMALLLAIMLILSLYACGTSNSSASQAPATADNAMTANTDTTDTETQEKPAQSSTDVMVGSDEWYAADTYDHAGREPFKIAYVCNQLSWVWNKSISDSLEKLGEKLNYTYTAYACNNDYDAYINQIATFADQGYEGFVIGADDQLATRAYEVCKELNVAFVAESTSFLDDQGNCIWPSVQQAQYKNGAQCAQWLVDNYKNYWKESIDTAKLGMIVLNYSAVSGIAEREPGAKDVFLKTFPEATANYYHGDLVSLGSTGFSVQGGNDMTTSLISAHPEVQNWFIVANVDDWATGATRAAEALGMEDKVLVTSVQADAFLKEMESGYKGNVYVSANAVSSVHFAKLMAANLVTILEGRATAETIWPEWISGSGAYARVEVVGDMITRDTYEVFAAAQVIS